MAKLAADGTSIVEIDSYGNIVVRDFVTGAVIRALPGPIKPGAANVLDPFFTVIDQDGDYAAFVVQELSGPAEVTDISTGAHVAVPGGAAARVAYAGELLLVQRPDGTLEVRSADGQHLLNSFAGIAAPVSGPVVSSSGLAVELDSAGNAVVYDVASGEEIGSVTLPAACRSGISPRVCGSGLRALQPGTH